VKKYGPAPDLSATPSKSSTVSTSEIGGSIATKSNLAIALRKANSAKIDTFKPTAKANKRTLQIPVTQETPVVNHVAADDNAEDTAESAVVVDSTNYYYIDFLVLMEPIVYQDSSGKQKIVDITKPIRSPNRSNSQLTGVYHALQEKGNLKTNLALRKNSDSSDINASIEDAIGDSK
jgi:hypothetical protein